MRRRRFGKIIFVTGLWCVLPWSLLLPRTAGGLGGNPQADSPTGNGRAGGVSREKQVDLNRATLEELMALPSIGPVLAKRIIDHRRRHGRFRRPEEVIIVAGMSATRYRRIAHLLVAGPVVLDALESRSESTPAKARAKPTWGESVR